MNLSEVTFDDLINELKRRQELKEQQVEDENKKLPQNYLPYELTDTITNHDAKKNCDIQFFLAHVDDGCEGFQFIIKYDHVNFNGIDKNDSTLIDTVKHCVLTMAEEGGWLDDLNIENIENIEIGRYGLDFIKIDGTKFFKA